MEFLIDQAAARHDQRTVPGRERLVAAVLPTLRTIADPVRRDGYVQLLARRSGVDERTLLEALRRPERGGTPVRRPRRGPRGSRINLEAVMAQPDALDPRAVERTLEPAEATLLRLLLTHPSQVAATAARLGGRHLRDHAGPGALEGAPRRRGSAPDGAFDRAAFVAGLEPTLAGVARTLLARTDPLPASDGGAAARPSTRAC